MIVVNPIDPYFTRDCPILDQIESHENAKKFLNLELPGALQDKGGVEIDFVTPSDTVLDSGEVSEIQISELDPAVFTWHSTNGVQGDIQKDGKRLDHTVILYGVASQFNACEATFRFTPPPGEAFLHYFHDHTQGPGAQLQFDPEQVEIINLAANLGYNALCRVLDEETKTNVEHGYLTPKTGQGQRVTDLLETKGHLTEYPCIGSVPSQAGLTGQKVHQMLVAAPAYGAYFDPHVHDNHKRDQIEYLCALMGYRAQFNQAISLAKRHNVEVVFKPTAVGLSAFGNQAENVAKAFFKAAKEYEGTLSENHVSVKLQVYKGRANSSGRAMPDSNGAAKMAYLLNLELDPSQKILV